MDRKRFGEGSKTRAVNYYSHFPRQFLHPYGNGAESFSYPEIVNKIQGINCEFLVRPEIGFSKLGKP